MLLGVIEEGKLKGKKVILEPRVGLENNIFLVEKGTFFNGAPMFSKHCLSVGCEKEVDDECEKCNKKD